MNRPALIHPRRTESVEAMFPQLVSVGSIDRTGAFSVADGLADLSCMFEPESGRSGSPEMMQTEAPAADRIVINGDYPACSAHQHCVLTMADGTTKRRFQITKVAPGEQYSQTTVLTVTVRK